MENWFEYDREHRRIGVRTRGKILVIKLEDMEVSFFSEGHGGQNVNRHMNGVRLIYNIPEEFILPYQKTRQLMTRTNQQRSREQNLEQAFDQLAQKVHDYFHVPAERKGTKIPFSSKQKRLQKKTLRGKLKHERGKVDYPAE